MTDTIPQDILSTFKSKNYRLIFCIGYPGSGMESQVEKVSNEFKYNKINLQEIIKKEISEETDTGKKLKDLAIYPKEIITNLIIFKCLEFKENQTILIQGFPNTLDEAQYYEQNIGLIELIIKFNASKETCIHNLKEIPECSNLNEEDFNKKYDEIDINFKALKEFYETYSLIREIDCNKSIDDINYLFKQNLYPVVYSIIGKRYSGKTTLSKILKEKTGIEIFDFNEFLENNNTNIKYNDKKYNEILMNKLIFKLRQKRCLKILIEDFPQNKEQYIYFCNNCKNFKKIYYLESDNSTCLERLNKISYEDPNYITSSKLSELLYNYEQKKDFFDFLKNNGKLEEINVNNHLILTIKQMMKQVQPYVTYIDFDENCINKKEEIFNKLKTNYNFYEIDINKIIENAKIRKLIDNNNNELNLDEKINLIRPILFRDDCNKIILNSFPNDLIESDTFESKLCSINKYIVFSTQKNLLSFKPDNSMWVKYYTSNILNLLNPEELTDFKLEETLDMINDISIVYGPPGSGKTTLVKHLKEKYNYELLDFKDIIEQVKKTKIDPENPDAEPEINFPDLVEFLKNFVKNPKNIKNKKLIIDNILIIGGADPFLIDTYEKAKEIIDIFGNFKNLYEIYVDENNLLNKYKAKEGINEEMTEEQKQAYEETLDKPKKLLEDIKLKSANIIKVDCNENEIKSLQKFDAHFGINLILIKHDYDLNIEKNLEIFSAKRKILYINVPKLIYKHFYNNDTFAKKLESSYGRKPLKEGVKNEDNFDEKIYYKYNPIKFEPNLVNKVIMDYISKNSKIIEDSGNYVILTGYLNNDLIKNDEGVYNLPLLELNKTMELGEITCFIQITKKNIQENEDEKPVQLIIEKPKKKIETDPLDVDGPPGGEEEKPEEEAPPEEENPDGVPKFKPENFSWTNYDGRPRNYVQILKRLKNFDVNMTEFDKSENYGEKLEKIVEEHIEKYDKKDENKYKGIISVLRVTDKETKANEMIVMNQL